MKQLEKTNRILLAVILTAVVLVAALTAVLLLFLQDTDRLPQPELPTPEPVPTEPPRYNAYKDIAFHTDPQGFVSCPEKNGVLGIDVSSFQGDIDWEKVKQAGVEYVFIRVGYRGNTEGGLFTDSRAQSYYEGAKKAGIKVGAYFFSQAISIWEAEQEAWFVLRQIKNWELDMPVVYDWEWVSSEARTAQMSGKMLTRCTRAFCRIIENAGLTPMIYFNTNQGISMLELESLDQYPFWLAQYGEAPNFPVLLDYWQYSCTGTIPGIETPVDLNLYFPEQ